jgi:hypothetical protein
MQQVANIFPAGHAAVSYVLRASYVKCSQVDASAENLLSTNRSKSGRLNAVKPYFTV